MFNLRAVMVHFYNAAAADAAVMGPLGLVGLASTAILLERDRGVCTARSRHRVLGFLIVVRERSRFRRYRTGVGRHNCATLWC
jgi:hypothetical protein